MSSSRSRLGDDWSSSAIRQQQHASAMAARDSDQEERNGAPWEFPEYGAIFMSNLATRKECYKRRLLGLPSGQARFVKRVKAGMVLFLFEHEQRELHGVFQASCDGAINIVPHAFSSSGRQFPAQVRFTTIWRCAPLSENEFRDAIRENYFSAKKFGFGLSERQVKRLLKLFSSKKLEFEPHRKLHVQSEVVEYPIHLGTDAVGHGSAVFPEGQKDERNECGVFEPTDASEWLWKSFRNEFDNGGFLLEGDKDEQNEHGSFEWRNPRELFMEHSGNQERATLHDQLASATVGKMHEVGNFGEVGRLADSEPVVIGENPLESEPQPVGKNYSSHSISANRRWAYDAGFSETYRPTEENDDGAGLSSSVPSRRQNNRHSPDICFPKPFVGVNSCTNSQLHLPSIMHHAQKHDWLRSDYGDAMRRGRFSHSPPGARTTVGSTNNYNNDVSSLNYDGSLSLCDLGVSRLNSEYIPPRAHNSSATEGFSPCHCSIPSLGNVPSPGYQASKIESRYLEAGSCEYVPFACPNNNQPPYVASATANQAIQTRKRYEDESSMGWSFPKPSFASAPSAKPEYHGQTLISEGFSPPLSPKKVPPFSFALGVGGASGEKLDHRLLSLEASQASAGYIPALSCCQTRSTNDRRERMPLDPEIYPPCQTYLSDCQMKRANVFSRLALPAETIEKDHSHHRTGNESALDFSVSNVMSMLHKSRDGWTKEKCLKLNVETPGLDSHSRTKKKMTSKTKLLKDQAPNTIRQFGINRSPACVETDKQIAGEIPFVDFKRRSKVRKSDSNATENNQNNLSGGQQKRRRLIRPIFCQNDKSGDNMFGNNSKESRHDKMPVHDGQEQKDVDVASCSKSEAVATIETQHDKMPELVGQEEKDVDLASCSKFEGDQIMEILELPSRQVCNDKEELSTEVYINMEPTFVSGMVENDESKSFQNADLESTRSLYLLEHKDVEGKRGLATEAKEDMGAGFSSVVMRKDENQAEASQHFDVQDVPAQQSDKEKTLNVEEVLIVKNSKDDLLLQDDRNSYYQFLKESVLEVRRVQAKEKIGVGFSSTVTSKDENENEASQYFKIQEMPSQPSDKDRTSNAEERWTSNAEERLMFKNSKGDHLLQDGCCNYYRFLHESVLEMHREQAEMRIVTGVPGCVNSKSFQKIGTHSINSGSICSSADRSQVSEIRRNELGNGKEEDELLLSLGSLTRQYNLCFQGNLRESLQKEV